MKSDKNFKKRLLSGILSTVLLANFSTILPITVFADDETTQETVNATVVDGHRYQLYDMAMNWNDAAAYCEGLGGHLVTIASGEEQLIVEGLLSNGTKNNYWLGGSVNADGNWAWVTGEAFVYENWANEQPDNYLDSENALMMYRNVNPANESGSGFGLWNDLLNDGTCNNETFFGVENFGFICEWESVDTPVEEEKSMKDYALFSASQTTNLSFYGWKSNISGNVYSGASFVYGGSELYIDGIVDTVGSLTANGWKTEISEINENITPLNTLDLDEDIHKNAQPYEYFEESPAYVEDKTVISSSIKVAGDVVISGTTFEGDCYIIADGNITYNVESFSSTGRVFLYSRNGNITINGSQININGAMYAPNGNVAFNTYDTTVNGFIWADSISYSGSIFNVTGANFDMVEPKSIVKTYTIDEDFNEGTYNGLALTVPNQLVLSEQSGGTASSAVKVFGDTETGKGVKITYSSDKSTVSSNGDTVNISYGLSGFGEADIDENAVDLIIVVDESGSMSGSRMRNTKAAAKEIIAQMKENDRCAVIGFTSYVSIKQSLTSDKELLTTAVDKLYANGGTAIYQGINSALEMFDTMSSDERQKYIILLSDGEDGATAQSLAAAKTAGENGIRIFAMMIGSGTLQMQNIAINSNGIYKNAPTTEDIGKIMSYFAAEVFNVAGRNTAFKTTIKDKNAVDISALSPAPSKITENEDSSVTLEWDFDRITIDEEKTITIPLTVNAEDSGFAELTENTSCVYYDRNGKPNVVYADDVALPISNYAETGSWSVVFDSERADVNWKNIYWNGKRYGDGTISVQASVSADGVAFSNPVEIRNYENLSGLSGRYIKLEVSMTVSSDGRTPELYDITVASEDAVLSEFTNEEPTLEIISKNVTKVNVPMHIRASLADDCLKSDITVAWSCESSNVKFEDSSKLMTTITCSETGSYDIICTISDGEKSVQAVRTVVCEPADSYADIDPDNEDEAVAPQISVILPQYADTNEVISAKIENLNNTEVSWYSVIFNTSTAVNVADDGSFTLTMPNRNGTYPVVVRAFDWAGKSDVKEYSIIVDSTSAAVEIIPSSDEAVIGTDAYFKVSTAGEHKIKYLEYTLNGEAITIPEDGIVTVDTSAETEYILEANGETITGKTLSAFAKITVIEADTKKPEVQIAFNKSSYNEGNTAIVTITASDNVGVTELEVLLNGEAVTLDSNNQFRITGLKYGEHVITANAYDEAGNKGTATKTLIAKDVTKPTLVLSVDKTEIKVGESINITVEAADNNGIVNTVLTVNNKELELTEGKTAVFTPDTAGTYTVKAVATDPSGNKQTKQVTVAVEELDTIAPVVTVSLDKDTYFELDDIIINVSATDNVGVTDTVLFIDGTEVELDENGSYTIKNAELKSYEIIAKAYDEETNEGTASETVVVNEAKAPEINVTFDKDMYIEGDSLEGLVTAQGQREIITLTAKVNGNPLTLEDGIFSIASLSAGEYTFVFTAEDAKEFTSVTEKKITVLKKENADRRLYAAIDGLVKYGETATLKVIASDEIDKATISVQLNGEDIELTSELTYEFTGEKLFDNEFVVSAETTDGEKISITVTVTVYETNKPIITLTYDKEDGYYDHDDVIATVTAEDVSGIKRVQFLYDGVEYPIDENGVVIIKDFVVQHHSVIIRAWDNFGNCRTMVSVFVVREVEGSGDKSEIGSTDDEAATLIAELYTPLDEQVITSPTFVVGTAGGTDFAKYRLDYASVAGGDYTLLKEGTSAIKENILGEFDPTMLRNGLYKVRLTVWDTNDNVKSAEVLISVEGQMKIGNFSLDFQDLDVNVSGAPLTVIRGYDSRDRNISGDFGYGWNISTCGVTITKSCNLSTGWTETQSGYNYLYSPTRPHIISVNWGNGQTEKFAMKLTTEGLSSMHTVSISFESLDGSGSELISKVNTSEWSYENGEIYKFDWSSYDIVEYNPDIWQLNKADGTKYLLSCTQGVLAVLDANGNQVTFNQNAIIQTDADGVQKSIAINRDSSGRITSIVSPTGKTVSYEYDENGDLAAVTDVSGKVTKFEYEDHYLTNIIDPRGVSVSKNIYDDEGRLIKTIDADGNEITYSHDVDGREEVITDRNGGVTRYIYDQSGNIVSQTDPMGNTVKSTYDSNGNLASKTDAMGNVTNYSYDENGNMLSMTDAEGNTVTNEYNSKGLITSIDAMGISAMIVSYDEKGNTSSTTDALGNSINYSYDNKGNLKSVTDEIGTYMVMTYDSDGNVISATNGAGTEAQFTYDSNGNCLSKTLTYTADGVTKTITESYTYDEAGNLVEIIDSDGNITSTEYNSMGKIARATDEKGRQTSYEYDDLGNLVKITYADGTSESFTYDREGNNLTATDRLGRTVTMTYDKVGNLTAKTYPNGAVVTYTYDANYNLISETSTSGGITTYEYDKIGRNTAIVDALGNRTAFAYNSYSQLASMTDAKGYVYTYTYDLNGNRIQTTYPDGSSVSSTYDARGRVTSQTDQHGYITSYIYDGADRLTGVTDPLGNTTSYTYDEVGNLIAVKDANGNTTNYTYDDFGRVIKTTNALGQTAEMTYDICGNVLTSTDYAGKLTSYTYDEFDRITSKTTEDGTITYSYTVDGKLSSVEDNNGITSYTYDGMDGLTKVVYPDGSYVAYTYDDYCRLTSVSTAYGTTSYEYDKLDRLVRVVDRNGYATVYEYDANGNRSAVKYANGIVVSYDYDEVNRLVLEKALDKQGGLVAQYEYTLGAAGERTAVKELNRTVEYTYDALYRLTSEKIAAADGTVTTYTYAYDKVSNRILKTENGAETVYTYNALNQLTAENDITYVYDAAGNLISAASQTKSTLYVYNAENKLIRATVQEGNEVSVEEYEYDYAGNRTVKKSEGEYTYYLNDISGSLTQVLAEIDADGNEKCWYTRGIELISQERSGVVSYYLIDGHGSVRQLADTAGTVTDTYVYDAWGNLISSTGETENSYLYCGEQLDSTTGLYYLRARYMNPTTGTFISMDTYQGTIFDPTSLHKYLYANANPVSFCDPSGYLGVLSLGMGSMGAAAIDEGSTLNYVAIYHSLVNLIRGAVATYGATRILATVMLPFAAYMGGKIAQSYSNVLINSALEVVTKYGKSIVIASALNIAVSTFIQHALDWVKSNNITNNRYNNAMAKHHIVPKGMDSTFMSRIILSSVGINCYTKSTLSPNIVVIKYSTHYAIHSNNDAYCAFVNSVILSAYCASASSGYAQQVVAVHAALFSLRTIIRGLDNIIP